MTGLLTVGLGCGIWGLVKYWDWLDGRHVAGVIIIGLLFGAIFILGMALQVSDDVPDDAPASQTLAAYMRYLAQVGGFIIIFLGLLAVLVILTWKYLIPFLGYGLSYPIFLVVFLLCIRAVIAVLSWLADRRMIGPPED